MQRALELAHKWLPMLPKPPKVRPWWHEWLFVLAIVLMMLAATGIVRSQEVEIRCANGMCLIGQQQLEMLIQLARKSAEYRELCGWEK